MYRSLSVSVSTTVAALLLVFLPLVTSPAITQATETNWMRHFVQSRVLAKNLRSITNKEEFAVLMDIQSLLLEPRIVGGSDANTNDNPFQVALLYARAASNTEAQFCGGTLVRKNMVVTAAHCSDFITNVNDVEVLTGTQRLDGSGRRRDVASITIHPSWDPDTFDNDVAVWELATSATEIPLASLATNDGAVGLNLLATGWGATSEGGNGEIDLQRVLVPLVARSNCNDSNSYDGEITANMICAGLDAGGRDACQGDSGGPLTRGTNNRTLTGITSWGFGCARPNLFGVYTRVSRPAIRSFIESTMADPPIDEVEIRNVGTGLYLDVRQGQLLPGSRLWQWGRNTTDAQLFNLLKSEGTFQIFLQNPDRACRCSLLLTSKLISLISNGPGEGVQSEPESDQSFVNDVILGERLWPVDPEGYSNIFQLRQAQKERAAQRWQLRAIDETENIFAFISTATGEELVLSALGSEPGAPVGLRPYSGSSSQHWQVENARPNYADRIVLEDFVYLRGGWLFGKLKWQLDQDETIDSIHVDVLEEGFGHRFDRDFQPEERIWDFELQPGSDALGKEWCFEVNTVNRRVGTSVWSISNEVCEIASSPGMPSDPVFRRVVIQNCDDGRGAVRVWKSIGGGDWQLAGVLGTQWSEGSCPSTGQPMVIDLEDNETTIFLSLSTTSPGCGSGGPIEENASCRLHNPISLKGDEDSEQDFVLEIN